jgi:hypothetical protein
MRNNWARNAEKALTTMVQAGLKLAGCEPGDVQIEVVMMGLRMKESLVVWW